MKKTLLTIIVAIIAVISIVSTVKAEVEGITAENYLDYEKPIKDEYGFNKGECNRPYLEGEEFFYDDYYDHWNVDKVYDKTMIPKKEVVKVSTKTVKVKVFCKHKMKKIKFKKRLDKKHKKHYNKNRKRKGRK